MTVRNRRTLPTRKPVWDIARFTALLHKPWLVPALLAALLLFDASLLVSNARGKRFWYDEVLTFHVSALYPFSRVEQALAEGADGMPPGYYRLVQLAREVPGDPHVVLRLPSIAGYLLALIGVYALTRRRVGALAGLAAAGLIMVSPFRDYAIEARGYAPLVGFLAVSAALWQGIRGFGLRTLLFAVSLALAVACHHLAVVSICIFAAAEMTRTVVVRQRFRWHVWAAFGVAAIPFLLGLPILLRLRDLYHMGFWSHPVWGTAARTYGEYAGMHWQIALALVGAYLAVAGRSIWRQLRCSEAQPPDDGFDAPELVLIAGLMLYPPMLVAIAMVTSGGYVPRYGWPAILGLSVGFMFLVTRCRPAFPALAGCLAAALLGVFAFQSYDEVRLMVTSSQRTTPRSDGRWELVEDQCRLHPDLPVLVSSAIRALEAAHYAPPLVRRRLIQVVDPQVAMQMRHVDSIDKTNLALARFTSFAVQDPETFLSANPRFLVYSDDAFEWMTEYLMRKNIHLRLISKFETRSVYLGTSSRELLPASSKPQ